MMRLLPMHRRRGPARRSGVTSSLQIALARGMGHQRTGTYAVDPSMAIPPLILTPLARGESKRDFKNLQLIAKNGPIEVDIWVVGRGASESDSEKPEARATLDVLSYNGAVNIKLHTNPVTPTPFMLTVTSYHGGVQLHLPQSFKGPLSITSNNGGITYSDQVRARQRFSEVHRRHFSFVGDSSGWTGEEEWEGDAATVQSRNGKVHVSYADEGLSG
ncbi:hypothetical protein PLICRDRAFT_126803 [Plicaturopsis crispa FD-325 SS-3]|uniref:Unplaced genomic scaffold PLICRscaffold_17, whole genome shotgun sequence n=1 Tax=Plicaturopsis crispa FD-325 SS-3 TaxID=944288 RepID=A0A0C9SKZ2_PLICR|nr:hypothetical protein PLICRDRAFT_126803 [Plicaturopsis crispa FD-325 SS-3]